jgi:hypothetical protein
VQTAVLHAVLMPTFRFVVEEILSSIAGFEGPVIAGRVLDTSGGSIAVFGLPSGADLLGLIAEASVSGRSD